MATDERQAGERVRRGADDQSVQAEDDMQGEHKELKRRHHRSFLTR